MNFISILLFTTLFSFKCFSLELDLISYEGFERKRFSTDSVSYRKNDKYNTNFNIKEYTLSKKLSFSNTTLKEDIKKIGKIRRKILSFMSIRDWTINQYNLKTIRGVQLLNLQGNYIGFKGKKVQFIELNIYNDTSHTQISFTQDRNDHIDKQEFDLFLRRLKNL